MDHIKKYLDLSHGLQFLSICLIFLPFIPQFDHSISSHRTVLWDQLEKQRFISILSASFSLGTTFFFGNLIILKGNSLTIESIESLIFSCSIFLPDLCLLIESKSILSIESLWIVLNLREIFFLFYLLRLFKSKLTSIGFYGLCSCVCVLVIFKQYSFDFFSASNPLSLVSVVFVFVFLFSFFLSFTGLIVDTLSLNKSNQLSRSLLQHIIKSFDHPSAFYLSLFLLIVVYLVCVLGILGPRPFHRFDWQYITALWVPNVLIGFFSILFQLSTPRSENLRLLRSLELKRLFVRYVSHEIRTPLNTVSLGLQLLKDLDLSPSLMGGTPSSISSTFSPSSRLKGGGGAGGGGTFQFSSEDSNKSAPLGTTRLKERNEILGDVTTSCQVALELLNQLLLYEKLEGGLLQLETTSLEGFTIVKDIAKSLEIHAMQSGLEIRMCRDTKFIAASEVGDIMIRADKSKLSQVLRNLISNAIKFSPKSGEVIVEVSVQRHDRENNHSLQRSQSFFPLPFYNNAKIFVSTLKLNQSQQQQQQQPSSQLKPSPPSPSMSEISPESVVEHDATFIVKVIDQGAGLTAQDQAKLFKQIIQFNANELQAGGGSGIGLFISKGIMDLHRGQISVHSEGVGKGSTFSISLPATIVKKSVRFRSLEHLNSTENERFMTSARSLARTQKKKQLKRMKAMVIAETDENESPNDSTNGKRSTLDVLALVYSESSSARRSIDEMSSASTSSRRPTIEEPKPSRHTPPPNRYNNNNNNERNITTTNTSSSSKLQSSASNYYLNPASGSLGDDLDFEESANSIREILNDTTMEDPFEPTLSSSSSDIPVLVAAPPQYSVSGGRPLSITSSWDISFSSSSSSKEDRSLPKKKRLRKPNAAASHDPNCMNLSFLIVDDSVMNRKMLLRSLKAAMFISEDASQALDGQEAVDLVRVSINSGHEFDFIIMDYQMPRMDGPTATKLIREMGYQGIIIGLTGNVLDENVSIFLEAGADKVMPKPLDVSELRSYIQALWNQVNFFIETAEKSFTELFGT